MSGPRDEEPGSSDADDGLVFRGPSGVTVISRRKTGDGWIPITSKVLVDVLPKILKGGRSAGFSARNLEMTDEAWALWDSLDLSTKDGWSLAQVRENGRIVSQLRVRETTGASSHQMPPLDPAALATVAVMAQLQASIEELAKLMTQVLSTVTRISQFLEDGQRAKILAAAEIITAVHDRLRLVGVVSQHDRTRLHGLESVLRQAHHEVLLEIGRIRDRAAYSDPSEAEAFLAESPNRVSSLVELEVHVLSHLTMLMQLDLVIRGQDGEQASLDSRSAADVIDQYRAAASNALNELARVDTRMAGRNWWDSLWYKGWVGTPQEEEALRKEVGGVRSDISARASAACTTLERLGGVISPALPAGRRPIRELRSVG